SDWKGDVEWRLSELDASDEIYLRQPINQAVDFRDKHVPTKRPAVSVFPTRQGIEKFSHRIHDAFFNFEIQLIRQGNNRGFYFDSQELRASYVQARGEQELRRQVSLDCLDQSRQVRLWSRPRQNDDANVSRFFSFHVHVNVEARQATRARDARVSFPRQYFEI